MSGELMNENNDEMLDELEEAALAALPPVIRNLIQTGKPTIAPESALSGNKPVDPKYISDMMRQFSSESSATVINDEELISAMPIQTSPSFIRQLIYDNKSNTTGNPPKPFVEEERTPVKPTSDVDNLIKKTKETESMTKSKLAVEMDRAVTDIITELMHNDTLSEGQRIAMLTKYMTMCQSILKERFGIEL